MPVLKAEGLRKEYQLGDHLVLALDNVDIEIIKGEFIAIMGPSGSGKSTLLHLLGGLDVPTAGSIFLADNELSQLSDKQITIIRRRNIGFIFQFFNLLPTLTAEENILLPVLIDGQKIEPYRKRVDELIQLVGLEDRRSHKPDQLSGGEQQRVSIARALITDPAIVLADEPTGNLDTKTGKSIMELLRRSCDKFEQTIIVVTHDPRAAAYADRVIFLRDGQQENAIVFMGSETILERNQNIMKIMESLEI